jgi:hypothetical protein
MIPKVRIQAVEKTMIGIFHNFFIFFFFNEKCLMVKEFAQKIEC